MTSLLNPPKPAPTTIGTFNMTNESKSTEREEFEDFFVYDGCPADDVIFEQEADGEYSCDETRVGWIVWQHQQFRITDLQAQLDAQQDSFTASQSRASDTIDLLQTQLTDQKRVNAELRDSFQFVNTFALKLYDMQNDDSIVLDAEKLWDLYGSDMVEDKALAEVK